LKNLALTRLIANEPHQLYQFENDEDFSRFAWRIPYEENHSIFKDVTGIDLSNLYWVPMEFLVIFKDTTDKEIDEMRKSTVWAKNI
jgi:hypothetical protein